MGLFQGVWTAIQVTSCTNRHAGVVIYGVVNSENISRYIASVERVLKELGISSTVQLLQTISRTSAWLKEMENINGR